MYKYILESIDQLNLLAIVPLIVFFSFFIIMVVLVIRADKTFIEKMAELPLEDA